MSETAASGVQAQLARAIAHHEAGRLVEAEADYLAVAAAGYRQCEVLDLLAGIALARGEPQLAFSRWQEVLERAPNDPATLRSQARVLRHLGRWQEAADALSAAAAELADDRDLAVELAVALYDAGRYQDALVHLAQAKSRWPNDVWIAHLQRHTVAAAVPSWHAPMLNDRPRNDAFEGAIRRAVAALGADARVLDIGTGSGLLAMMAARAGAARVIACEADPVLADTARRVVATNGYADRIHIVGKRSRDLVLGADLDAPADLLVSEILSSSALTEGVLATFEDAIARLLRPGAAIIPRAVSAVGCLAAGAAIEKIAFVGAVSGFDLAAFAPLASPRVPIYGFAPPWTRLSADHDLVRIDLMQATHGPMLSRVSLRAIADGTAVGMVQWLRIELDAETTYANPPESGAEGGWQQVLHTFPKPIPMLAGQTLELNVGHDRASLILMPV